MVTHIYDAFAAQDIQDPDPSLEKEWRIEGYLGTGCIGIEVNLFSEVTVVLIDLADCCRSDRGHRRRSE
jgi:hypothetical protein